MALLHRVIQNQAIQLPNHCNNPRLAGDALVLGPSAALNRDITSTSSVKNSSQTVPQSCVPHQSTASQPPPLVTRSQAWDEYFQKYTNTNTFHFHEYEYEYEYISFKSIRIRILFEKYSNTFTNTFNTNTYNHF